MKKEVKFDKNILIIGYGSVSRCTLPIFLEHVKVPLNNVTIIDFEDKAQELKKFTDQGIKFEQIKITPENIDNVLMTHVGNDGVLIDLAWNIGANDIINWCHNHNTLYVNTSVELWDSESSFEATPYEKSLYYRQMKLRDLSRDWHDAPTAIVDHGANPGLISHFTKQGLLDIAGKQIADKVVIGKDLEDITEYVNKLNFAKLSQKLGVKVIHCSERDTQITNQPKDVDEFVGTWSIEGLREEGVATAEMGWGTHEKELPNLAYSPTIGPKNQIFLAQMGIHTKVRSWIPNEEIVGMVIRHGEAFGISDRLTVWENEKAEYRPTVHYAYMPCHETLSSLWEFEGMGYQLQSKQRIMSDEVTSGKDTLGALLMGHHYQSWWTGSILDIEEARKLLPGQNATTIQVALGVISAVMWAIENPRKGICLPDDLPHNYVLDISKPYLGSFISQDYAWNPLMNRKVFFKENPANNPDSDPWQFKNFLLPL